MAVSAHGSVPTLAICVVGLSQDKAEDFHRRVGIGKSCLCYRFIHPGYDDYISDHPSLLALHEFESPVINSVHSLYWGATVRGYPIRGTVKDVKVQYHVVEHTVFYQDVTSLPFTINTKPDSLESYMRRVTGPIESSGKISYRTRDAISLPDACERMEYPSGVSKLARGFILVVDVSQKGAAFERQLARAEQMLSYFQKHQRKFIIVATKREMADPTALEKTRELKKKYKTQLMETSARDNLNIADAFRVLAAKVLKKKVPNLSDHATTYEEASFNILAGKSSARRSFSDYLTKRVTTSDHRLSDIEGSEEYKGCVQVIGKFETGELFSKRLLRLRNEEVERLYVGVYDNPDLRQEFLDEYVEERRDLSAYSSMLKKKVQGYVDEHRASVLSSESANGDEGEAAKSPDQSYHIFEKKVTSRLQAHDQFSAPQPQSVDGSDTLHASCDDSHSSHSSSSYEDVENFHSYQNLPHPPSNTTSSLHQGNGMEPYLQNDKESQGLIPEYPPLVPERHTTSKSAMEPSPALQNKTPPPVPKKGKVEPKHSPPTSHEPLQPSTKEVSQFPSSNIRERAALLQKVLSGEESQETVAAIQESADMESGSEMPYLPPQQQRQESSQVPAVTQRGEETSQPIESAERDVCPPHPPAFPSPVPPPKPARRRAPTKEAPLNTKPNVEPSKDSEQPVLPVRKAPPSENAIDGTTNKVEYVPKLAQIRKRVADRKEKQALQLEETPPQVLDPPSRPVKLPSLSEDQVPVSPGTVSPPQKSSPKPTRPAPPPPLPRQRLPTPPESPSRAGPPLPTPPSPGAPTKPPLPTPTDPPDPSPVSSPKPARPAPAPPSPRQSPPESPGLARPHLPTPPSPRAPTKPPLPTPTDPPDPSPVSSPKSTRPAPAPPVFKQPLLPALESPRLARPHLPTPPSPRLAGPPATPPKPLPKPVRPPLPESSPVPVRPPLPVLPEASPELLRPPPPPPPPVDEGSTESDSLVSEEEGDIAPPVPERREEMFEELFKEELADTPASTSRPDQKHRGEKSKKRGKLSYEDVKLKLKKLVKSESKEGKEKQSKDKDGKNKNAQGSPNKKRSQSVAVAANTRAQFVDMSKRPLPQDPYLRQESDEIDHDADDYEPIDFEEEAMRLSFLTAASSHRSNQYPTSAVRRAQSFQQTRSIDVADLDDFRNQKFPLPLSALYRRPVSQQIQTPRAGSESPETDSDGYVDTEQLEETGSQRPLPLTPFQIAAKESLTGTEEAGLDYDYPDLRVQLGFSTLPPRGRVKKPAKDLPIGKVPLPHRSDQPRVLSRTSSGSDYIHMDSAMDDSYVNWETMHSIQSAHSEAQKEKGKPPAVPRKPQRYSSDDMVAYVNLPTPGQVTMSLPPRMASVHSPLPEKPSPSAVKKPSPKPRKKVRNATTSNAQVRSVPRSGSPPSPRVHDAVSNTSQTGDFLNPTALTSFSLPERSFVFESKQPATLIPSSRSENRRSSEDNTKTMSSLVPPRTIKRTNFSKPS